MRPDMRRRSAWIAVPLGLAGVLALAWLVLWLRFPGPPKSPPPSPMGDYPIRNRR